MTSIKDLNAIGTVQFSKIGNFTREAKLGTDYRVNPGKVSRTLFAITVDGVVMALGESIPSLDARVRQLSNPGPSQTTNHEWKHGIIDAIRDGSTVELFAVRKPIPADSIRELRDHLIDSAKPTWSKLV